MTEYDKKIKELNDLIDWFDEHGDKEMTREDDVFVVICPADNDVLMHKFALGDTSLLKAYLINTLNDVEMRTWRAKNG